MRLALVTAFPPGQQSLNEYGYHLARELTRHPDVSEVVVIADVLTTPMVELNLGPKLTVHRVWKFNAVSAGPAILRSLASTKADAVLWNVQAATFGNRELPAALGLLAPAMARVMGTPSGVIAHNVLGAVDLNHTQLRGQKLRQGLVQAGGSIVNRALMAANYVSVTLDTYLVHLRSLNPRADVTHIPHGTFDCAAPAAPPLANRPSRIVTMGKFGTYKRLETLLAAFDILRQRPEYAGYELVIGGTDHPSVAGYMSHIAQSRRTDRGVHFAGYVAEQDVPGFFHDARIAVFDYLSTTGSSGVLHQAASFGTVPVFPDIGDFVAVSQDEGISGANYLPNNATDLARAMRSVLDDAKWSQAIADKNQKAAAHMPLSQVAAWHVDRLQHLGRKPRPHGTTATATAPTKG
ncbi:hypothetical protein ACMU_07865 [Actibacterium mucosum KCTC 23349]|uniref:Glycosyl transferase family 1 domain-containing protein n=1 Tax=Actibacterium mucosum KCTC 23349 TaxID=1454373 RepID=A0A037ZK96_9RHOB|nr:glycosyltransferase [Actibacterium mucosum]KAJ56846.1 hypothetical protein ACMU_07865 [Actibacterium mucosum KCTC 23349]